MKTKLYILTITLLLVVSTTACSHQSALRKSNEIHHKYASHVNWKSLQEGLTMSETIQKPALVVLGVEEGCHRCEFIQKNVYGNDEVQQKINTDFIPIFIDLDKPLTSQEIALGEKYDFKHDCLLLFLNHKGEVIHNPDVGEMCFVGKIEPQEFIEYLDYILQTYNHNITY